MIYGSGIAVNIIVPKEVRKKENEVKKLLACKCNLLGCYAGGHKIRKSKRCKYHTCDTKEEINKVMDSFM